MTTGTNTDGFKTAGLNAPGTAVLGEAYTPQLQAMAKEWYRLLDVHAPMLDLMPMLARNGLSMVFPEATLHGQSEFEGWYQGVIRIFFDEVHEVRSAAVHYEGGQALMDIVVHWEASVWKAPARHSARISLEAYQRWVVELEGDVPVIKSYIVDRLEYHEGSARL
jgi:hypothetical protein